MDYAQSDLEFNEDSDEYQEVDYPSSEEEEDEEYYRHSAVAFSNVYDNSRINRLQKKLEVYFQDILIPKVEVKPRIREECVICLESIQERKNISYCKYSCGNTFHQSCTAQLKRCPLCRKTTEIVPHPENLKNSIS